MDKSAINDGSGISALPASLPKGDLAGSTAEDDIRRAIFRYGPDAVKAAVKSLTKPRRGRPLDDDSSELHEVSKADAREWLAGGDPLTHRTNYSIAKGIADKKPGQSAESTRVRIKRKLGRKPYDRRWFMLTNAEIMSRDGIPHADHIRTLEALARLDHDAGAGSYQLSLYRAKSTILDYWTTMGAPPAGKLSMREIEDAVGKALLAIPQPSHLGALSRSLSMQPAQDGDIE